MKLMISDSPPFAFNTCSRFPVFEPSVNCPFPGYSVEIIKMLTDWANITLEPVVIDSSLVEWGTFENGSWTGMLKLLEDGVAEVMTDIFQYTSTRADYFDYSYPLYNLQVVYITKETSRDVSYYLTDPLKPFTWKIWVVLLASFIVSTGLAILTNYVEFSLGFAKNFNPRKKIGHYFRMAVHQAEIGNPSYTMSDKLGFTIFGLVLITLFTHLYSAFLLSPLLIQTVHKPFNDFDELISFINSGRYHVVVDEANYRGFWYFDYLRTSNESHFRKLRTALMKNPLLIVDSIPKALDVIDLGNYVYPSQQDQPEMIEAKVRCGLSYLDVGFPQTRAYLMFHKNSSFLNIINTAIRMNTNFIAHIFDKYFSENFMLTGQSRKCVERTRYLEAATPLSLKSTAGMFLLFGICTSCSLIGFVAEHVYCRYWRWRVDKNNSKDSESVEETAMNGFCINSDGNGSKAASNLNHNENTVYCKISVYNDTMF